MFSQKTKKRGLKAFTLIEMLIVIVIIGILAVALIPRLMSAVGRADDTARKADLQQVANSLVVYNMDKGQFPSCPNGCPLSSISTGLIQAGTNGIPTDPKADRKFYGIGSSQIQSGQFGYTPIMKSGISGNGFVLMAASETEGGANYVVENTNGGSYNISSTMDSSDIHLCIKFSQDSGNPVNNGDGTCTYDPSQDQLRYIYVY